LEYLHGVSGTFCFLAIVNSVSPKVYFYQPPFYW